MSPRTARLALLALPLALAACKKDEDGTDDTDTDTDVDTDTEDTDDTDDTDVAVYTVSGTVSGLEGDGLQLALNDDETITLDDDGSFSFTAELPTGTAWEVTVAGTPTCPSSACTVSQGSGTIADADVTDVAVTCAEADVMLFTSSWGDNTVRITDDLHGYADGATATPRLLAGANTGIDDPSGDAIDVDAARDLLYVADDGAIKVFEDARTVSGNVAPDRFFVDGGVSGDHEGVAIDSANDRLYVGISDKLLIFDDASTLDGSITADVTLSGYDVNALFLDTTTDTLWVAGEYNETVWVFDDASSLTSASTPDRTLTWTEGTTGFNGPATLAVDACTDRLYLGSNWASPDGRRLVVFDDASTLDGAIDLTDATSGVSTQSIAIALDGRDRLLFFADSATKVQIWSGVSHWDGPLMLLPPKEVLGVVNSGYGMAMIEE